MQKRLRQTYNVKRFKIERTHKPLSNPLVKGVHGATKLDWVTEWFLEVKLNKTMSPAKAI